MFFIIFYYSLLRKKNITYIVTLICGLKQRKLFYSVFSQGSLPQGSPVPPYAGSVLTLMFLVTLISTSSVTLCLATFIFAFFGLSSPQFLLFFGVFNFSTFFSCLINFIFISFNSLDDIRFLDFLIFVKVSQL